MAGHAIPLCAITVEQQQKELDEMLEREALKFAKRVRRRVLRLLRDREGRYDKDAALLSYIVGLVRMEGVQAAYINSVAELIFSEY